MHNTFVQNDWSSCNANNFDFLIFSVSFVSVSPAISDIRLSTVSFDSGMSFILLAADCPNTSLQAAIKQGLMSSLPMEYGFLHLTLCNDIN